jgi:hypothetical protein
VIQHPVVSESFFSRALKLGVQAAFIFVTFPSFELERMLGKE